MMATMNAQMTSEKTKTIWYVIVPAQQLESPS